MATNSIITKVTGTDSSSNRIGSTFYGTCATAAGTAAKAVTLSDSCVFNDSCLITGVTIHVKFTYSNTNATPTLKVGTATAKQIMSRGTTKAGTTPETSWYEGAVVSFTYDGTYWQMNDHIDAVDEYEAAGIAYDNTKSGLPATNVQGAIDAIISAIYPVGSIYMSVNNVNPGTYLLGTTWEAWGAGRVPVGVDTTQAEFITVEKTGGGKTTAYTPAGTNTAVYLTAAQSGVPAHTHETAPMWAASSGAGSNNVVTGYPTTNKAGSYIVNVTANTAKSATQSHNHTFTGTAANIPTLQPYITCYMWKRTA